MPCELVAVYSDDTTFSPSNVTRVHRLPHGINIPNALKGIIEPSSRHFPQMSWATSSTSLGLTKSVIRTGSRDQLLAGLMSTPIIRPAPAIFAP